MRENRNAPGGQTGGNNADNHNYHGTGENFLDRLDNDPTIRQAVMDAICGPGVPEGAGWIMYPHPMQSDKHLRLGSGGAVEDYHGGQYNGTVLNAVALTIGLPDAKGANAYRAAEHAARLIGMTHGTGERPVHAVRSRPGKAVDRKHADAPAKVPQSDLVPIRRLTGDAIPDGLTLYCEKRGNLRPDVVWVYGSTGLHAVRVNGTAEHEKKVRPRWPKPGGGWLTERPADCPAHQVGYSTAGTVPADALGFAVHEGERAMDAAADLLPDWSHLTAPQGNNGLAGADWSGLVTVSLNRGLPVHLVPDADKPGRDSMGKVAVQLHGAGVEVRWVDLFGDDSKRDAADYPGGSDDFRMTLAEAAPWQPPAISECVDSPANSTDTAGDVRNAQYLAGAARDRFLYCPGLGWLQWTGTHWEVDAESGEIRSLAIECAKTRLAQSEEGTAPHKAAAKAQGSREIRAAVELAQAPHFGLTCDAGSLDSQDSEINLPNGILDLRTFQLRPHDPLALHTRVAGVEWVPGADAPQFRGVLSEWMEGDSECIAYLQTLAGLALTGDIRPQEFFVLLGDGENGKSVVAAILRRLLGKYAAQAETATFLNKAGENRGGTRADLLGLRGKRLVLGSEVPKGARWDESVVKSLTGGDSITARAPYDKSTLTFQPKCLLLFLVNDLPAASGGHAWTRRLRVIPWSYRVPTGKRRLGLDEYLFNAESSGIMAWAVEGLRNYRTAISRNADPMPRPKAMLIAEQEAARDCDPVSAFLNDRCDIAPGVECRAGRLYAEFGRWWKDHQGDDTLPKQAAFGRALSRISGLTRTDRKAGIVWVGVDISGGRVDGLDGSPQLPYIHTRTRARAHTHTHCAKVRDNRPNRPPMIRAAPLRANLGKVMTPMMNDLSPGVRFDPHSLYSTAQLESMLRGICSLETLRRVLGVCPRAHGLWLGADLVTAMERLAQSRPADSDALAPARSARVSGLHRHGKKNRRPGGLDPITLAEVEGRTGEME